MQTCNIACEICPSRGGSLFSNLNSELLFILSNSKNLIHFKKGKMIFCEGNRPTGFYCINSGKVKIYKMGLEGKEQIVRMAKAGSLIGYRSLISNDPYGASAKALEDSSICFIPQQVFVHFLKNNVDFEFKMIALLSDDIKIAENQLTGIAQKSLKSRLAETLLKLKHFYGSEKADERIINVILTREELANLVGTAQGCIIRLLSELKEENIISLVGKKIRIENNASLLKLAHSV